MSLRVHIYKGNKVFFFKGQPSGTKFNEDPFDRNPKDIPKQNKRSRRDDTSSIQYMANKDIKGRRICKGVTGGKEKGHLRKPLQPKGNSSATIYWDGVFCRF